MESNDEKYKLLLSKMMAVSDECLSVQAGFRRAQQQLDQLKKDIDELEHLMFDTLQSTKELPK